MRFDPALLLLTYTISNLVCAIVVLLLWRSNRHRTNGLGLWLADFVLQLLGTLLLTTRGVAPDFVAMVLGTGCTVTGTLLLLLGLGKYLRFPVPLRPYLLGLLLFVMVHSYFTVIDSDPVARNVNFSLALSVLCGHSAWLLLRPANAPILHAQVLPGIAMAAFTGFNVLRIAYEVSGQLGRQTLNTEQIIGLSVLVYQTLSLTLTFGLVLMVNRGLTLALRGELDERRQLLTEMRRTQDRLQRAELRSGFGHWELDIRSMEFSASEGAMAIYEVDGPSMARSLVVQMVCDEDRARVDAALVALIREGRPYNEEYRIRAGRTGQIKHIHALGERDPARQVAFGVVQDITATVQARQQLEQARDAAEVASRAKTAFLANMSHEIRSPLHAISGMAHMMRAAGLEPAQMQRLDKLETASRHLLQVINDILDISKIEAGKMDVEQRRFHLDDVVDSVLLMLSDRARAKQLEFRFTTDVTHHWYLGDATRLQQALINYGANAIKFTEQGSVHIHVHSQEDDDQGSLLCFEVRDTGIGITAEQGERLFSSFEQADTSMTRKFGGTGLGLAITRQIARLMGGDVGYRSTPGAGSTFWFTARLAKAAAAPAVTPDEEEDLRQQLRTQYSGTRVLVADDDPMNQEIALFLLEDIGLVVDVADDGQQACTLAATHRYAMVFLDVQMPVMDGLQAARQIRALPEYRHTPLCAMTGNAFNEDRQRCQEAGMDYFVSKPVEHAVLYRTVQTALQARTAVPTLPAA